MSKLVGILSVFIALPIWFFLLYRILDAVNATELMWFLYWIYVPASIVLGVVAKLAEGKQ